MQCDGQRPICSQCQKKGTDCQFDTDDLRRITNLRNLNQKLSDRVAEYEDLVTRLQQVSEDEAIEVLRQLRGSRDFAEGIERFHAEVLDASASPSDEGLVSPGGVSRDPGDLASFRGSTWHPALQIRVSGSQFIASADAMTDDLASAPKVGTDLF